MRFRFFIEWCQLVYFTELINLCFGKYLKVKSAQELENEKIAKEVEKLHKQIKMMKKRNSAKQMDTSKFIIRVMSVLS